MTKTDQSITGQLMRIHGIDVAKYDADFLEKSLQRRVAETGCGSREEYCHVLDESRGEATSFIASLQISYSEFFRNPLSFALLERLVLPSIVQKKKNARHKEIRIWSAACAGGQEAYSLAILLEELSKRDRHNFRYRIIATDQSELQVQEAKRGRYAAAALNNLSLKRAGEWFTRQDDIYTVKPELKKNIDFSTFDLFDQEMICPSASIFGDFDLVICANILFYYQDEGQKIILRKVVNSLSEDGYLMTGEAERAIVLRAHHHEIFPSSAIFRK